MDLTVSIFTNVAAVPPEIAQRDSFLAHVGLAVSLSGTQLVMDLRERCTGTMLPFRETDLLDLRAEVAT